MYVVWKGIKLIFVFTKHYQSKKSIPCLRIKQLLHLWTDTPPRNKRFQIRCAAREPEEGRRRVDTDPGHGH